MNWMSSVFSGLAGGANAVQNQMQEQQRFQQQEQLKMLQAQVDRQKMIFEANLRAPTEDSYTQDDPDPVKAAQGWKQKVKQIWQIPTEDGQKGHFETVGTEAIPPHWEMKEGVQLNSGVKGSIAYDPNTFNPADPKTYTVIGQDDTENQRTMIERANSGINAARLAEESRHNAATEANAASGHGATPHFIHFFEEDPDTGQKTYYKFNNLTGEKSPIDMAQPPNPPGYQPSNTPSMYAGVDPAYAASQFGGINWNGIGSQPSIAGEATGPNSPLAQLQPSNNPRSGVNPTIKASPVNMGGSGSGQASVSQPARGTIGVGGQANNPPGSSGKPSLSVFLNAARKSNPNATDAQLTAYYNQKYGGSN